MDDAATDNTQEQEGRGDDVVVVNNNDNITNNNPADKPRVSWCFTWNNPPDDAEEILKRLFYEPADPTTRLSYLIYGRENAETTGTYHLQGFLQIEGSDDENGITSLGRGGPAGLFFRGHWSKARSNTASRKYCRKTGNFQEYGMFRRSTKAPQVNRQGKRSDMDLFLAACEDGNMTSERARHEFAEVYAKYQRWCLEVMADSRPDPKYEDHPLYPWQRALLQHLTEDKPGDREIIFVVDRVGNSGKSWLCKKLLRENEGAQLLLPGKIADMAYAVNETTTLLMIDCPRSRQELFQYDFIEYVKNGLVFSSKYESRMKKLEACHVVVFMNEMPDTTKLSTDRYVYVDINPALKSLDDDATSAIRTWNDLLAYFRANQAPRRPGFVANFFPN